MSLKRDWSIAMISAVAYFGWLAWLWAESKTWEAPEIFLFGSVGFGIVFAVWALVIRYIKASWLCEITTWVSVGVAAGFLLWILVVGSYVLWRDLGKGLVHDKRQLVTLDTVGFRSASKNGMGPITTSEDDHDASEER